MKFRYKGRSKRITIIVQEGDELTLGDTRAQRIVSRIADFEPVQTRRKRSNGSDKSGNSEPSA